VPTVLGLDPSLTSFGGAVISSAGEPATLYRWKPPAKMRGHERLQWLLDHVEGASQGCTFAVIEGVAGSGVQGVEAHLNLAGLHWLVSHHLWQRGIPCAVVQPTVRQKYITGLGRADKDVCLLAVERRFPDIGVGGNDTADAFTLAHMGADWAGFPLAKLPAGQRAVLTSIVPAKKNKPAHPAIAWPDLKEALSA
jgi:Holliday junction resolvasome RuvABC endonuclease subunit